MANFEAINPLSEKKLESAVVLGEKLAIISNLDKLKMGVDLLVDYRESIP